MKLQKKLMAGFLCCALITLAVALFAVSKLQYLANADAFLYEKATAPMEDLLKLTADFQRIRLNLLDFSTTNSPDVRNRSRILIQELRNSIDVSSAKVEASLVSQKGRNDFAT